MGKKRKKRLITKINPEKSNKMIYAVGVGILILFILGVAFVLREDEKLREGPVQTTINSLKKSDKTIDVKLSENNNNIINVILKEKDKKFIRDIKAEAIDLSDTKRDIKFEFIISISKIENTIYSLKVKGGEIVNFRSLGVKTHKDVKK
jgi:hypothetical protein